MISFICGILKKGKEEIHRYREQIGGCKRYAVVSERAKVLKRHELPVFKYVTNTIYSMVTIMSNTVCHLKVAKRVGLKNSHCKKTIF